MQHGCVYDITDFICLSNCQMGRGRTTCSMIITTLILDALYDSHHVFNKTYSWKLHHEITSAKVVEKHNTYLALLDKEKQFDNAKGTKGDQHKVEDKAPKEEKSLSLEEIAFRNKAQELGITLPEHDASYHNQQKLLEEGFFPSIRTLLSYLPEGQLYKYRADILIDVGGDMQNLRTCLQATLTLYLQSSLLFPHQAHKHAHRGKNYFIRYIVLLLAGSYLYQGGAVWFFNQILNSSTSLPSPLASGPFHAPTNHANTQKFIPLPSTQQSPLGTKIFTRDEANPINCSYLAWLNQISAIRHLLNTVQFPDEE
jgi:hypothetical protein